MYLVEGDLVVKKEGFNGENNSIEIGKICVVEEVKRIKNSSDQYIIRSLATGIASGWWVDSQLEFCCAGNDKIIEKARELLNKNKNKITLD